MGPFSSSRMQLTNSQTRACTLLLLLLWVAHGEAAVDAELLSFEIRSIASARLVFNQEDLASCIADETSRSCLLRAPIKLDGPSWRTQFAKTGGVAVIKPGRSLLIAPGPSKATNTVEGREVLDWNSIADVLRLMPGSVLRLTNLTLLNWATKVEYSPGNSSPYYSVGVGMGTFPTFNFAPNSTVVGVNITSPFVTPSDTDDCARFVARSQSFLLQSFGPGNVTAVNSTGTLLSGPVKVTIPIRNGSTFEPLGEAAAIYKGLLLNCLDKPGTRRGKPLGVLAAAIAVPLAAACLGGAFILWWCYRRRHPCGSQQLPTGAGKPQQALPEHTAKVQGGVWRWCRPRAHNALQQAPDKVQAPAVGGLSRCSTPAMATSGLQQHNSSTPAPPMQQVGPAAPAPTPAGSSVVPEQCSSLADLKAQSCDPLSRHSSTAPSQRSVGTAAASNPDTAADSQRFSSESAATDLCREMRSGDSRADTSTAVLKARSDAAVVKGLRLGRLLGEGCFGKVYKGWWNHTPVAVKCIEHSSLSGPGSSRGMTAGRELLFATSVSHPNVVETYHISTISSMQHRAGLVEQGSAHQDTADLQQGANSRRPSTCSDVGDPGLSETWVVMELCPKGSLEDAMQQGKLRTPDGQPAWGLIYKALLDTASGLDYLHSIGVVHGDLKTANCLLSRTRDARGVTCKITDFGLSRVLGAHASHVSNATHGTLCYSPKERLLSGRMTTATDIYCFGLLMWELLTSQHILEAGDEGLSIGQMFYMIAYQNWRPQVPEHCPPGYAELMAACWHDDPEQRPTAQQLLKRLQMLDGRAAAARKARSGEHSPAATELDQPTVPASRAAAGSEPVYECTQQQQQQQRMAGAPTTAQPYQEAIAASTVSYGPGSSMAIAGSSGSAAPWDSAGHSLEHQVVSAGGQSLLQLQERHSMQPTAAAARSGKSCVGPGGQWGDQHVVQQPGAFAGSLSNPLLDVIQQQHAPSESLLPTSSLPFICRSDSFAGCLVGPRAVDMQPYIDALNNRGTGKGGGVKDAL